MLETTSCNHVIRGSRKSGKTTQLKNKCLYSREENVLNVWITNAIMGSDEILNWPARSFYRNGFNEIVVVNGIVIIKDDMIDALKKLCETYEHKRIDLYIDDYDFLYENMKHFIVNHRKLFGDITVVERSHDESH